MDHEHLRQLIDRYLDGMTSEEEEAHLRKYLSDPFLPLSLKNEFGYLSEQPSVVPEPSSDFFNRLDELTVTRAKLSSFNRLAKNVLRIAAAAVLLMAVYFFADNQGSFRMKDTYSDPVVAMAEVKSILALVSDNMNAGRDELSSVTSMGRASGALREVDRMNMALEETLGRLQYLNLLDITTKEN